MPVGFALHPPPIPKLNRVQRHPAVRMYSAAVTWSIVMRTSHLRVLAFCIATLVSFSVWGLDSQCGDGLAPPPPLNPQWKGVAYQGMIDRINPKHVQNVKILFLGDPVPAVVQKHGRDTALYGYGGLVGVRKKSILGLVNQSVRFYLIDANGILIKFTNINEMEQEAVTPESHRVVITVTGEYKPNPNYDPPSKDKKDDRGKKKDKRHGRGDRRHEPEYIWVPKHEKSIVPVLDAYQEERLIVFQNTSIDRQPVYQ